MDKAKAKILLRLIQQDMIQDATNFEGKPFNGINVSEYLGNLGAAIEALSRVMCEMLEEDDV